jgi:phosphopantothenoylcysteine synthetase/decarboxylase
MKDKGVYEIRIGTVLDGKWGAYFSPFMLILGQSETILTGVAHDQAELFGILLKIRDLGLELVSVNPVELNQEDGYK